MDDKNMSAPGLRKYSRELIVSFALILCVAGVYGQVSTFEFATVDDPTYVKLNCVVKQGLTLNGVKWAFTSFHAANWHPLTWISHMLDVELYGMWPGMHHLTNVALHAVNAVLLFLLLRYGTGALWKGAFVAALFALHPLHVESVAWVAERKDVLSAMFWLLAMLGYVRYVKGPSLKRYLPVAGAFALGLLAKPMLVTLPFALLLLDYWPLRRLELAGQTPGNLPPREYNENPKIRWSGAVPLVLEKLPLFAMAAASCIVTFVAQNAGGAVSTLQETSLSVRFPNAFISYALYLWKMVWPSELAVFYPLREPPSLHLATFALALVLLLSFAAVRAARSRPYFITGWLWYLGTLVPVIGFVQVGAQSMADRYTYLPLIGIFMLVTWGAADLFGTRRAGKAVLGTMAVGVLAVLSVLSWSQTNTWKDSVTLFTHAVSVTENNFLSSNNLGCALYEKGDTKGAIRSFKEALRACPGYAVAHANLGLSYAKVGDRTAAIAHYLTAMKLGSSSASSHYVIAQGLSSFGCMPQAIREYRKALQLDPDHVPAWIGLGQALDSQGKAEQGKSCYLKALEINPGNADAKAKLIDAPKRQRATGNPCCR